MTDYPFPMRLRTAQELNQLADELRRDGHHAIADVYQDRMADAQDTISAVLNLGTDVTNAWNAENERSIREEVGMDMALIGRDMYARLVDVGWVPPTHLYRPEPKESSDPWPVVHHPRCDGNHTDGPCRRVVDSTTGVVYPSGEDVTASSLVADAEAKGRI